MEISSSVAALTVPLPIYTSTLLGTAISREGGNFLIFAGLDTNLVAQLKKYSLNDADTDLQENTSDRERFGEGSYEEWYARKRVPFALVKADTGTLAAICWFGPKPLGQKSMKHFSEEERKKAEAEDPGDWRTISYRCYGPYRGKGLMKTFVQFSIDAYLKAFPEAKLWAITAAENDASSALSTALGFKKIMELSDSESLVMVKE